MDESEDLLSKADALMARHRTARPDPDIPVLQEVVDVSTGTDDLPVLTEMVDIDRTQVAPRPQQAQFDQPERLRAEILAALQPEIDALVEERLKERLEPLVEKLFWDLRDELQTTARDTMSAAITRAIDREFARRKSAG